MYTKTGSKIKRLAATVSSLGIGLCLAIGGALFFVGVQFCSFGTTKCSGMDYSCYDRFRIDCFHLWINFVLASKSFVGRIR